MFLLGAVVVVVVVDMVVCVVVVVLIIDVVTDIWFEFEDKVRPSAKLKPKIAPNIRQRHPDIKSIFKHKELRQ